MRQATGTAKIATKIATKTASNKRTPAQVARPSRKIEAVDVGEPLLYDIRQAAAKLSLSYRMVERLIASGDLFSVLAGGKRLIPAWATVAYTRALCEQADPHGRYTQIYTHEYGLAG